MSKGLRHVSSFRWIGRRSRWSIGRRKRCDARTYLASGADLTPAVPTSSLCFRDVISKRIPFSAAGVSLCLGVSVALFVVGLTRCVQREWVDQGSPAVLVVTATLLGLALGLRAPRAIAGVTFRLASRYLQWAFVGENMAEVWYRRRSEDRSLYWVVLSVVSLLGGVASALLPAQIWLGFRSCDWVAAQFLWTPFSRSVLQLTALVLIGALPLSFLGLAMSFAHRLSSWSAEWDTCATGWLLVGAAVGLIVAVGFGMAKCPPELLLAGSALPTLTVAALCAALGTPTGEGVREKTPETAPEIPVHIDRWPVLLRLAIVGVGGAGACVVWLWCSYHATHSRDVWLPASVMLASMGTGMLLGCRFREDRQGSMGGFGLACLIAGVMTALGIPSIFAGSATHASLAWAASVSSLTAIGFALAYGRKTLLQRVAARASAGAVILTRICICCAITIGVTSPLVVHYLGTPPTLILVSLTLVALAGTLIIHDPEVSTRTRTVRLGAVFGILGLMIATAYWGKGSLLLAGQAMPSSIPGFPVVYANDDARPSDLATANDR